MRGLRVTFFCMVVALTAACHAADDEKYNVVFVLTDDQRFDQIGFLNPEIDTPHMDQMAQQGVFFRNAFVTTSLCSPSRASILTGKYAHTHGIVDNLARDIAPGTVFFPEYL